MQLRNLKSKSPKELVTLGESYHIENAGGMRKQELLFAILTKIAENKEEIYGDGVLEILSDGFGFLRSMTASYLAGPDDIYVSPMLIRKFGLKTGDTIEGEVRQPK